MKRNNVKLTLEDRKCLESIIKSNKNTAFDKLKAQVLLLTDIGQWGQKFSCTDIMEQLKISSRSIGRIKAAYAQNSSIQDVFRFPGLSDQSLLRHNSDQNLEVQKKKNFSYVECENKEEENGFLCECAKYKVNLTQDERKKLESILKEGKQTIRKFNRAKILLLADEGPYGPAMINEKIADKLEVSISTIQRVRKLLISKGRIEDVLNFKHQNAGRLRKIDGEVEATLVALACSKPPEGRCRWTLRLLADRLIELKVVDSITHGTIRNALKKTNLNLGNARNG